MGAYCECSAPAASGITCACPDGSTLVDQISVFDLPPDELEHLGKLTIEANTALARGDRDENARLRAKRDSYRAEAIARFKARVAGKRRADDMTRAVRQDDPTTDRTRENAEGSAELEMLIESATAWMPASQRADAADRIRRDHGPRIAARVAARTRNAPSTRRDEAAASTAAERKMNADAANAWKTGG